jgi:hypothetical protein
MHHACALLLVHSSGHAPVLILITPPPHSSSLILTPPRSSLLFTPHHHSSSLLITRPPPRSSLILTPHHSSSSASSTDPSRQYTHTPGGAPMSWRALHCTSSTQKPPWMQCSSAEGKQMRDRKKGQLAYTSLRQHKNTMILMRGGDHQFLHVIKSNQTQPSTSCI